MEPFKGKLGVIGAGALGCFYGARLAHAGHDVHFLMRRDYEAVRRGGLHIYSIDGDFTIHPPVYDSVHALGRCDLVLIGLKTTDQSRLAELLPPCVGPETLVLTLQNGLGCEEAIEAILSEAGHTDAGDRILGATAFLCSTRGEPGVVHHTAHGHVHLAEYRGPARERTRAIGALFESAGIRCRVLDSLAQARWTKLIWNVPFNGLGVAASHADTAVVLEDPELRAVALGLMEEVADAARALGLAIGPDLPDRMMRNSETMGPYRSSMQIDYEERRPVEVESIIGEPLRRARAAGVATPRLEMLYAIVRRMDRLNREGGAD